MLLKKRNDLLSFRVCTVFKCLQRRKSLATFFYAMHSFLVHNLRYIEFGGNYFHCYGNVRSEGFSKGLTGILCVELVDLFSCVQDAF